MKKICFVVTSPLIIHFFFRNHFKVLSEEFEVYLVGNFSEEDVFSFSEYSIANICSISIYRKINLIHDLLAIVKLYKYFVKMDFDTIHSISPKAGLLSSIAGRLAGIKIRIHIFTGQIWASKKGIYRVFLKMFDKLIVINSTHILVDGRSQREFLINERVISNNSLILGNGSISGVDIRRFKSDSRLRKELRKELHIAEDTVLVLFLGRIKMDKGILDLVNAFKRLMEEKSDVFLLIVGYDEENMVSNISLLLKGHDRFFYYGPTSKPESILPAADIFCLPSYREGFGTSILEASCCKLPVICSDIYGLSDSVIDGTTGLKYEVRNATSLYKQLLKLVLNAELRKSLGENGHDYVVNNFSSDIISIEWLKFYRSLFFSKI
ncbi:MAG: glycosyltransferase [Bacteroidota bacterium]